MYDSEWVKEIKECRACFAAKNDSLCSKYLQTWIGKLSRVENNIVEFNPYFSNSVTSVGYQTYVSYYIKDYLNVEERKS